jgi:hypothetical protein
VVSRYNRNKLQNLFLKFQEEILLKIMTNLATCGKSFIGIVIQVDVPNGFE